MFSAFFRRQKKDRTQKSLAPSERYEKLPKTLKELDPSYRALIRELAKR